MMKGQMWGKFLLWLISPEDSSRIEASPIEECSANLLQSEFVCSTAKLSICYLAALVISVFLSHLH